MRSDRLPSSVVIRVKSRARATDNRHGFDEMRTSEMSEMRARATDNTHGFDEMRTSALDPADELLHCKINLKERVFSDLNSFNYHI